MNSKIVILNSIISKDDCLEFQEYIDLMNEKVSNLFCRYQEGKRLYLPIGIDLCYENPLFSLGISTVADKKDLFYKNFNNILSKLTAHFNELETVYVCNFWLAKQYAGSAISEHEDTDNINNHFDYTAIAYLNDASSSSPLEFPELNFSYQPKMGDVIVFKTKESGTHLVKEINDTRYSIPIWITKNKKFAL